MPKKKELLSIEDLALRVKHIIDHFDFDKVQRAMVALDWKWQHIDDEEDQTSRVPSIERMKETARHLLYQAGTQKERYWATGGFHAQRFKTGDMRLQFVVSEHDTCDNWDD